MEAPQEAALAFAQGGCIQCLLGELLPKLGPRSLPPIWDPRAELLGTSTLAWQFQGECHRTGHLTPISYSHLSQRSAQLS